MKKLKYEEKFIVINKKHVEKLPANLQAKFTDILNEIKPYIPENKYYVCNQDEPYAKRVIDIILQGGKFNNNFETYIHYVENCAAGGMRPIGFKEWKDLK
jgi:hypothetical protein